MPILIRSFSLMRGKIQENTNHVIDLSLSTHTVSSSSTTTTTTSSTMVSSKQLKQKQYESLLGYEKNLFPPEQEYKGVLEILHQLSKEEQDQLTDPQMPIRYYRAAKGNVSNALQQLRQTLHWRTTIFQVQSFVPTSSTTTTTTQSPPTWLCRENATGKIYIRGYDAQGRALVYMRPARENTHNEKEQLQHLVWNLEKAIACTRRESYQRNGNKAPLEKIILLIDYEGFSLTNAPPMSTTKATLHILQNMYPERMYRAYCLHPPMIFRAFWNMVRPFIDPVTKEKIVFVSNKTTQQQLWSTMLHSKEIDLETGAGGNLSPNDFDSETYLRLPFDQAYPTTITTTPPPNVIKQQHHHHHHHNNDHHPHKHYSTKSK